MNLTQENLQHVLSKIFFGDELPEHLALIVPLQGNFLNPQQLTADKMPSAYFTYYMSCTEKKTLNQSFDNAHEACVLRDLQLSCIGRDAEMLMMNTLFWDERTDVRELFAKYNAILLESPRQVFARPFHQHGENTILEYSTSMKLSCTLTLTVEPEYWDKEGLELRGNLIIQE